jgi:hypothetical protein
VLIRLSVCSFGSSPLLSCVPVFSPAAFFSLAVCGYHELLMSRLQTTHATESVSIILKFNIINQQASNQTYCTSKALTAKQTIHILRSCPCSRFCTAFQPVPFNSLQLWFEVLLVNCQHQNPKATPHEPHQNALLGPHTSQQKPGHRPISESHWLLRPCYLSRVKVITRTTGDTKDHTIFAKEGPMAFCDLIVCFLSHYQRLTKA